jgi:hypothetical protein
VSRPRVCCQFRTRPIRRGWRSSGLEDRSGISPAPWPFKDGFDGQPFAACVLCGQGTQTGIDQPGQGFDHGRFFQGAAISWCFQNTFIPAILPAWRGCRRPGSGQRLMSLKRQGLIKPSGKNMTGP